MLITVLQRHKQNRDAIKAAVAKIDPARADQICFGDDWEFTCRAIEQWPTRKGFVVCGRIFEDGDVGTLVARRIKESSPSTLFFLYSYVPDFNIAQFVDGIIPKLSGDDNHELLAKILTSNLEAATAESIRNDFLMKKVETG